MELWIIATLCAAGFQTLRFMLQKFLATGGLSATGNAFARFAYAQPFALAVLGLYLWVTGAQLPLPIGAFWAWGALGGLAQILATIFVVMTFSERNFAVGITLKKTEAMQAALLGLVLLGDNMPLAGWLAIGIGLFGVLLLSGKVGRFRDGLKSRAMIWGLGSGFFFAISGVSYRAATLEVPSEDPFLRAALSLVGVSLMQAVVLALWLRWREPEQIASVLQAWRVALWMGLLSMGGTLGWFTAFTLQSAAYVKALGQVELLFSLAVSVLVFRETVTRREVAGMGVLCLSILLLVFLV